MVERPNTPTHKELNLFAKIDRFTEKEKISYIQNALIPQMNYKNGRTENMSAEEVHEKLNRPAGSGKAGEKIELLWEMLKDGNADGLDAKFAAELADITYYGLQPNAKESDKFEEIIENDLLNFFYGIPVDSILAFCIIKYSTRLKFGDKQNYKEIEFNVLEKYLSVHTELTTLWKCDPQPQSSSHLSELFDLVFGENNPYNN